MRRAIIWFIAGIVVATAFSVHAEEAIESMIGKQVNDIVKVDLYGKTMKTVLIDGVTYVPLREFAESRGDIVTYDPETGVKVKKRISGSRDSFIRAIEGVKSSKQTSLRMLESEENAMSKLKEKQKTPELERDIKAGEERIKKHQADIVRFDKNLTDLEQQLAEFDAQEAELNPPAPTEPTVTTDPEPTDPEPTEPEPTEPTTPTEPAPNQP